jgi:hypothetical protein
MKWEKKKIHIACDYGATVYLIFYHFGHYLMKPGDYLGTPLSMVMHSVWSTGWFRGGGGGGGAVWTEVDV